MSYNSYYQYYSPYNQSCYSGCNPCYNSCQSYCQPTYQAQYCVQQCPAPCPTPCPIPCPCPNPCPTVSYITNAVTGTVVPSGGVPIPPGSTTIPAGTVTVIGGFSGVPTTNIGGIVPNAVTNQFTVPIAGRYIISGSVSFPGTTALPTPTPNSRSLFIYKVDALTGVITLLAADTREAVTGGGTTNITVTTVADLNAGDRIFFAATQTSGVPLVTSVTTNNRFIITRLC